MHSDYKKRLLYRQKAQSEEGHDVNVSVWATRYTYPGANHATAGRARISTVTNFNVDPEITVGTIETWRENGWLLIEEYMDNTTPLVCADDVEEACLKILEAFLMGVNFDCTGDPSTTSPPFTITADKPRRRRTPKKDTLSPLPADKVTPSKDSTDKVSSEEDDDDWL